MTYQQMQNGFNWKDHAGNTIKVDNFGRIWLRMHNESRDRSLGLVTKNDDGKVILFSRDEEAHLDATQNGFGWRIPACVYYQVDGVMIRTTLGTYYYMKEWMDQRDTNEMINVGDVAMTVTIPAKEMYVAMDNESDRQWVDVLGIEWYTQLESDIHAEYFQNIFKKLAEDGKQHKIVPKGVDLFAPFKNCSFSDVKVMIAADEPIATTAANGYGYAGVFDVNFEFLARQGIMFINRVFTTRMATYGAHKDFGWLDFYDSICKRVLSRHVTFDMPPVMVLDNRQSKLSSNHRKTPALLGDIKKLVGEFTTKHYNTEIQWN